MLKRFRLKEGIHVALVIALVTAIPRVIRFSNIDWQNILVMFGFTLFLVFSLWISCQYFIRQKCISKNFIRILFAITVGVLISTSIQMLGGYLFPSIAAERAHFDFELITRSQRLLMYLFRGCAFSALIYFIAYNQQLAEEKQRNRFEIATLKQENLEARLSLLKQQISPHFLFNSLSTLKTIAPDTNTKNYVVQLANVYRYLLNNKDYQHQNLVSVKEELAFTKSYLYILTERFEDALQVNIELSDEQMEQSLPPLSLQILIENAIKHNIVSLDEPLHITIAGEGNDFLVITNNLQLKLSTEDSLGLGLQNIKDRYKILSDKEISICKTEREFVVKIPLL
ncbi:MAG: histidine kinase [Prevotellaceae bacterium]|jgi:sensor histidine kinase YesM|nr:histidine kinase [Prevotellaceae bacterium]